MDEQTRKNCEFLIGCLDSHGYLDCPLNELAEEQGKTFFEMEQALFVIQSLDPVGSKRTATAGEKGHPGYCGAFACFLSQSARGG